MPLSDREYIQINQTLFFLTRAYESCSVSDEKRKRSGLALSDLSVLMVLGQFAPVNSRGLSRIMDINPGTISVYVESLVEKGLVHREQDQKDRRNWWLSLTESGKEAHRTAIESVLEDTRESLLALDELEQLRLHRLLLKVSRSLGFGWY